MAKDFAKKFYHSKRWLSCRASYIAEITNINGGMCEHCGNVPGYIVDHIEELTPSNILDPMISLNHDNFQYLCLDCHNRKTFRKNSVGLFDEDGQPLPKIF